MPQNIGILKELGSRAPGLPIVGETLFSERSRMLAADLGQKALNLATVRFGLYLAKPGTHISDRLKAQMPANQARIGAQYVDIAKRIKGQVKNRAMQIEWDANPDEQLAELELLKRDASAMTEFGYGTIAKAILKAETAPEVPDVVTARAVHIAQRLDMRPQLLVPPEWLSEFEAARTEEIMHEAPARIF